MSDVLMKNFYRGYLSFYIDTEEYVFTSDGSGSGEIIEFGNLDATTFDEPIEIDVVVFEKNENRRRVMANTLLKGKEVIFKLQEKENAEDAWVDFKRQIPAFIQGTEVADTGGTIISIISRDNLLISADGRSWSAESQRALFPNDDVFDNLSRLEFVGRNIEWKLT